MSNFSKKTQIYIYGTIAAAVLLVLFDLYQLFFLTEWILLVVLSVLASLSLLFKVEGATKTTHYNISFVVYAFTIFYLGAPAAVIIIMASHIVEWIWHRYPWYIQLFNVSMFIVVANSTDIVYSLLAPERGLNIWWDVVGILVGLGCFTLLNHFMVGIIVWLARGENFIQSGIFQFFSLAMDFIMLSVGGTAAVMMAINPLGVILVLMPLYLIYTTLRVPALERKTEIEPKTGLYHHRYFENSLETELHRANRFDRPLTVVMADLDFLRNINNTYGHLAGDEVLIGIANILKSSARDYDIVSRFGGEEFAILLPEVTPETAYPRIESIRKAIEQYDFIIPTSITPIKATMSFGIAGRQPGSDAKGIIQNADAALYHSKLKGRNRVYIYNEQGFRSLFEGETQLAEEQADKQTIPQPVEASISSQAKLNEPADHDHKTTIAEDPVISRTPTSEDVKTRKGGSQPNKLIQSRILLGYIMLLSFLAFSLLTVSFLPLAPIDWWGILIFSLLVAGTEWTAIDIYIRNTAVSISAVPVLAGTLLFGPMGALFMSLSVALVAFIKHRSPVSRFIFNLSNQLLATASLTLIIQLTGVAYSAWPIMFRFLAGPIMGLYLYSITSFNIALAIHFNQRQRLGQIWHEQFGWLAPYYLGIGAIAYMLVFGFEHSGSIGITTILIPLLLLHVSQRQFIDRTRTAVNELREKNTALEERTQEISRLNDGLLETLAEVIDLREPYVLGHSRQVTRYAVLVAQYLGLHPRQVEQIRKASLMHDVGKLGIHQSILAKPASLTPEEFENIKRHVVVGAEILTKSGGLPWLIPIVLHHHERWDGKGYPNGLKGEKIPLEARIVALADAIDAMASDRPYRKALSFDQIIQEVKNCAGTQFDPQVSEAFLTIASKMGESLLINTVDLQNETKTESVLYPIHLDHIGTHRGQFEDVRRS